MNWDLLSEARLQVNRANQASHQANQEKKINGSVSGPIRLLVLFLLFLYIV